MSFTSAGTDTPVLREPCWRDVYLVASARAVSYCGDMLAATALVLALQARGAGGFAIAAVLLASSVPMVLLAPLAGRLADRVDSRILLTGVGLAQAAVCGVLAYATGTAAIIGLVALLAAGLAISGPTSMALTPAMVGRRNLPRASALSQTAGSIGMLAGPALAGFLVDRYGLRLPLLLDAASYLAIAGAGLALRTRRGGRFGDGGEVAGDDPAGVVTGHGGAARWRVRDDALFTLMTVLTGAVVAAVSAINVTDVFFVRDTLHASATAYGLLGAVWVGMMAIGSWGAARIMRTDRSTALLLMTLFLVTSGVIAAAATVPAVAWLVPLFAIGGISNGGENAAAGTLIGRRAPAARRGHAAAVFGAVANGANAVGFLVAAPLLEVRTPRQVIAGCGIAGLLVCLACLRPVLRATRETPARDDAPAQVDPGAPGVPPVVPAAGPLAPLVSNATVGIPRARGAGGDRAGTVGNHERTAATPGRAYPVP